MKKTIKYFGILLLIVLVLFLGGRIVSRLQHWYSERPMHGALSFSETLQQPLHFESGAFRIVWEPGQGGALAVTHAESPDKMLWASVPGTAFAGAAVGEEQVVEHRGMFSFRDRILQRYPNQHINRIGVQEGAVVIEGALSARSGAQSIDYRFTLRETAPNHLGFRLDVDADATNRLYLTYRSAPEESFHGFGAQFTYFNLKGRRVPVFVMEQGIGRGRQPLTFLLDLVAKAGGSWHTSYAVAPHYITSAMRSLFLESYGYSVFDLRAPDRVQVMLFEAPMKGRILAGHTPADLIREYTEVAGRMRPLPDWIIEGAVVGIQGGTEKALDVWKSLQRHKTPVAAFWLQDWVGQRKTIVGKQLWWNWELDRHHYLHWEELLETWAQEGVRVMTYVNPFIIDPTAKGTYERNLFEEAAAEGYLIHNVHGAPYLIKNTDFSAAMLDLTNPDARNWMKRVMHEQVVAVGASGWMADFGEALPYDAVLHSGEDAALYHNRYPEVWAQLNREVIEESGRGDDFVFFMRSGYRESPRHATLFWLGDQMVTWDRHDGMKSAVTGLLSSGLSGYAFNHSDIGGYTAVVTPIFSYVRERELLKRWMEMNAFSVIFRTHEGVAPDANHQIYSDEDTLAHFSRCARIYRAWSDYRKVLVREAAETGLPVVRHPFIHYPENARVRELVYEQFMVGDVFMVAPVLEPGINEVACYLPSHGWTHLWTGQSYDAGEDGITVTVEAPLGNPAVFYKEGAPEGAHFLENLEALKVFP